MLRQLALDMADTRITEEVIFLHLQGLTLQVE